MIIVLLILICLITLLPQGLLKKYQIDTTTVIDTRTISLKQKYKLPVVNNEQEVYDNQAIIEVLGCDVCEILDKYLV
jgi:hypothetical protein